VYVCVCVCVCVCWVCMGMGMSVGYGGGTARRVLGWEDDRIPKTTIQNITPNAHTPYSIVPTHWEMHQCVACALGMCVLCVCVLGVCECWVGAATLTIASQNNNTQHLNMRIHTAPICAQHRNRPPHHHHSHLSVHSQCKQTNKQTKNVHDLRSCGFVIHDETSGQWWLHLCLCFLFCFLVGQWSVDDYDNIPPLNSIITRIQRVPIHFIAYNERPHTLMRNRTRYSCAFMRVRLKQNHAHFEL
jgi:hypothetical protein